MRRGARRERFTRRVRPKPGVYFLRARSIGFARRHSLPGGTMWRALRTLRWLGSLASASVFAAACRPGAPAAGSPPATANLIRGLERERIRALVAGDTARAGVLHAEDFQLVNPIGSTQSRAEYLGGVASGALDYAAWEPDSIAVRMYGEAAVLHYRSRLVMVARGDTVRPFGHWHTDLYERRSGRWQVVWSQATAIREHAPAAGAR
jgi:hypothetical protein